ncbi:MAG: hypothetical protein ACJ764_06795 [Solirubrobacteraceae bacterium]
MRGQRPVRRSGAFWVFCVALVAAACAAIALTAGRNQANPKGALAGIFGVIGLFLVVFFVVKTREIRAGKAADLAGAKRGQRLPVDDPTKLTDSELYAALALTPIDSEALRARAEMWDRERKGTHTGIVICVLIFASVLPVYLLQTFVPLLIGAPLIAGIALYKSSRLLVNGQGLDGAYDLSDQVMAPLGLSVTERYNISFEPRVAQGGWHAATRGALEMQGERYGRRVTIRTPATGGVRSPRSVRVTTPSRQRFELSGRGGRIAPKGSVPAALAETLSSLPASDAWNGVRVHMEGGVVSVDRKSAQGRDPLLDLWLAEHIADALGPAAA